MASKTYKTRAIVLKKTRLGEKDLIITLIGESGSLIKAVAKGARKPGSSKAATLELFSTVDLLLVQGRSLDIVSDAALVPGKTPLTSLEASTCASPLAELLSLVAQEQLEQPRLFQLAQASFDALGQASDVNRLFITAASLWKVLGQAGFKPSFSQCPHCGQEVLGEGEGCLRFSPEEGGVLCTQAPQAFDALRVDREVLRWCSFALQGRYDELLNTSVDTQTARALLNLARQWMVAHIGRPLRSLDFVVTSNLICTR